MDTSVGRMDERIEAVYFSRNSLVVDLMDGRTISVPLSWYPRLLKASQKQRAQWQICGGGYGIHWTEIDEDLSVQGLLSGYPAPARKVAKKPRRKSIGSSRCRKIKT